MSMNPKDADWMAEARDIIRAADRAHPLRIRGHGSKDFFGMPPDAHATELSTLGHAGVVDYDPTELVVVEGATFSETRCPAARATSARHCWMRLASA